MHTPGTQLLAEIYEQPKALAGLLEAESEFVRAAEGIRERGSQLVRLVGHGSSDNAASYGIYSFGLMPRMTAIRDSITLTVYYGTELDMTGSTVIGLSQSGATPDVVDYVERARKAGAFTIGITNEDDSPLAEAAEVLLPLGAGKEKAIVATKTYMNQVASLGLLAAHVAGQGKEFSDHLRRVIDQLGETIPEMEKRISEVAIPFAFVGRMFVIGRGVEFGTAREVALKLLESCRLAAEPLTATDLAHGPVAALDALFPVWAIASKDAMLPAVSEAVERIRKTGATLLASGNAASEIGDVDYVLPVPDAPTPLLSPLLSIIPGQFFAWAVAKAKGLDPDKPAGLTKVTLAL